jgi:hypothetical protein
MASASEEEKAEIKAANAEKMRVWRAAKTRLRLEAVAAANVVIAARVAAEEKANPGAAVVAAAAAMVAAHEAAAERRRNYVSPRPTAPRGAQPARLTGKENTAAAHERILKKIHDLTGTSSLNDHELITSVLRKEYPNPSTLATYLKHVALEFREDDPLFTIYKTVASEAEVVAMNLSFGISVIDWGELKNLYKKAKGLDKVFLALISLMPPRRTGDYSKLTIGDPIDSTLNYVVDDTIIYNNYKTKKTYGTQRLIMPKRMAAIIKKEMGDRKGNVFGNHMCSVFVRQIGNRAGIADLSMNLIRHSFITNFLESNPPNRLRLTMATAMAHSMGMQQSYERRE